MSKEWKPRPKPPLSGDAQPELWDFTDDGKEVYNPLPEPSPPIRGYNGQMTSYLRRDRHPVFWSALDDRERGF